jgi:hypothetical protein
MSFAIRHVVRLARLRCLYMSKAGTRPSHRAVVYRNYRRTSRTTRRCDHADFFSRSAFHWPRAASPFIFARCENAIKATTTFSNLPTRTFTALSGRSRRNVADVFCYLSDFDIAALSKSSLLIHLIYIQKKAFIRLSFLKMRRRRAAARRAGD